MSNMNYIWMFKMNRTLNTTRNQLVKMFVSRGMTLDESDSKADKILSGTKNTIMYYVTTISFDLCDIQSNVRVKTPAKYFNNLIQAKIFQLNGILSQLENGTTKKSYTELECSMMKSELSSLTAEYPEYVV